MSGTTFRAWLRDRHRRVLAALAATTAVLWGTVPIASPASAAGPYSPANGTGSSYAGLAFQQWVNDGQTQGLPLNYTPTSSPQGLQQYQSGIVPFAGTEAEFSSLLGTPDATIPGGFEYTPDVAGGTAVMYNASDQAGRQITYLHFSQRTVARIFMGYITNWNSPEISADNLGLVLPSHPIDIIYRAGQSGTTALFYDFVAHADPGDFVPWATAHRLPTTTRIIQLDNGSNFAPLTQAVSGSDQQAESVASQPWTISYDEFAYPRTYGAQVAWVQNGSGGYTQPYALNITAALEAATLNPDLSQNLAGVYTSPNPLSYPISAYSYIVTKCAPNPQFPTCKGSYADGGLSNTLGTWMSYIACGGQVHMAQIGYSPLPPELSQAMANSVARITGQPAVNLTAGNCANPRFQGLLGVGAAGPPDPYLGRAANSLAPGGGAAAGGSGGAAGGAGSNSAGAAASAGSTAGSGSGAGGSADAGAAGAAGKAGARGRSAGGGSGDSRSPSPVAYLRPILGGVGTLPLLAFLAILVVPALRPGRLRRRFTRSPKSRP